MLKFFAVFTIFFVTTSAQLGKAEPSTVQKMKTKEEEIRLQMIDISKQLGVTCTECHKMKNLTDGSMKSFQVAKDHLRIVGLLRQNGMDGKLGPEASCYMCHKGQLKFTHLMPSSTGK